MNKNDLTTLIFNILISWGYAFFCIALNLFDFQNLFFDQKVYTSFSWFDALIKTVLVKDLLWYGFAFLFVYFLLALVCFLVAKAVLTLCPFDNRVKKLLSLLFLVVVFYLLFIENAVVFPHTTMYQPSTTAIAFSVGLKIILAMAILFVCVKLASGLFRQLKSRWIVGLFLVILCSIPANGVLVKENVTSNFTVLPNIIIIGIDSLRPDILSRVKKTSSIR